ncbi:MAG: SUMF1/EgtB/PvdO family nonheme iron enzyme [Treponema sp.]|nr:SUMF1/EgtB/PvdO family nonheme iron enzyme [Treponema sp.]
MKKLNAKALTCALCGAMTFGFFSCYTESKYEETEANSPQSSGETETATFKNISMKKIAAGSFKFGDDTKTVCAFYMAATETTQKLYREIMGNHESSAESDDLPVDKVRFYETLVFCNKLSEKEGLESVYKKGGESDTGKWGDVPSSNDADWNAITEDSAANGFRLPHKDEWVFAALGTNASQNSGDYGDYYSGCIGKDSLGDYAWAGESSAQIHQVAQKKANSNGLYDMSGNAWELCWDTVGEDKRVRIGGDSKDCIPLSESWDYPADADWGQVGFRVVCSESAVSSSSSTANQSEDDSNTAQKPAGNDENGENKSQPAENPNDNPNTEPSSETPQENPGQGGEAAADFNLSDYLEMKYIAAGSFKFKYGDEGDAEDVNLGAFKISATEITQELYEAVMGANPSNHKDNAAEGEVQAKRPVDSVSFYSAIVFCNKLSAKVGLTPVYKIEGSSDTSAWGDIPTAKNEKWNAVTEDESADGFRIPHEKEWMFAALGDNAPDFSGFDSSYFAGCVGESDLNKYAWYKARFDGDNNVNGGDSGDTTHEVAKKSPNSNGLYDMSGNLWELCWETMDNGNHIRRGGGFGSEWTDQLALSTRWDIPAHEGWGDVGFRIVQKSE